MPLLTTSVSRKELLQKCIEVINTFDPKRTTIDAYVDDAETMKDKRLGELERKFVHQVVYGCHRYQKFLKLFVTSFLFKCPAKAVREDQTLYMILGYILFFRLEELEVPEFREFVRCGMGTDSAILALLQYALCVPELEKWVKMEWCKLYDISFVEQDVIGKLQSFAEELIPVVEEVEFKATGTIAAAEGGELVKTRKPTVQKPFNLTKPKPRLIPEPEVINRTIVAQPIPEASKRRDMLQEVEEEKRKRLDEERDRVKNKYDATLVPNLRTKGRAAESELEELTKKVEAERMAECTFKPPPPKNVLNKDGHYAPKEDAVVRQNVASVLREDALIRKKQAKEAEILKRYEAELHDAAGFHEWQQNQREKDAMEEEARVRQRMVEMQLAREEAIEAAENCKRKKQIIAECHKEEMKQLLEEKRHDQEVELMENMKIVLETQDDRERARLAEAEAAAARAKHAEEMRKQKQEEFDRKRREDQYEMEQRKDLIRQIRALEKVPVERFKSFDRAEPPAHGLMEEMSYAELQERLRYLQAQAEKERDEKRERQLEKKIEKQQELAEKAENLAKIREMAKEEARERNAAKKAKEAAIQERKEQYQQKCLQEATEKLALKKKQKRDEELRLKRELKEIKAKNAFRQAGAEMVEAKAHQEQQLGLEREARERQRTLLTEQRKRNEINRTEQNLRMGNRANDQEQYRMMQEAVRARMDRAKVAAEDLKAGIKLASSMARDTQREIERRGRAEFGHSSNRYHQRLSGTMSAAAV
mmetsp:Transcript_49965/g.139987  ORF Transcript_49965/g.139987 Transcript_49965/m.139987 type:complete len:764 (+) Transcript_49965:140-2431(+)